MNPNEIQLVKAMLADKAKRENITEADVLFAQAMALLEIAYQLAVMNERNEE